MKVISVWLSRRFNALLPELDKVFAAVMENAGVSSKWTHRSWIMRDSAQVIPLVKAWNQNYASRSARSPNPTAPFVENCKLECLYTNIDTGDMQSNIMQLVQEVFDLADHRDQSICQRSCTVAETN